MTISTPWCSLTQAAAAAPSGSIVLVRAGVYPYTNLDAIGSRSNYVTFVPFGFGTAQPDSVTIQGINTKNTSYLRFVGFHLVGSDTNGYVAGAQIYVGSQYIQFIDNDISGEGIYLQTASDVLLQGNYIHNVNRNCSLQPPDGGGIFLTGGSSSNPPANNLYVLGNTIQGTYQDAINLVHNNTNVLVDGNNASTTQHPLCGDHTDLVQIEGDGKGPYTIVDNVFHDGVQFILRNATGLTVENNLIIRVQQWMQMMADPGARVINNTWWGGNGCADGIHGCTAGSLIIRDYGPGSQWASPPFNYTNHMNGMVIENNIMREFENDPQGPVPAGAYHENYDLIYGPGNNSTGIQGAHTIFGPSYFVSPSGGDFDPAGSSGALDSADSSVAPATDFYGRARWDDPFVPNTGTGPVTYADRGAIEYQPPSAGALGTSAASHAGHKKLKLKIRQAFKRRALSRGIFTIRAKCNLPCGAVFVGRLYWRGRHGKLIPSFLVKVTSVRLPSGRYKLLNLRLSHASVARLRRQARRHHDRAVLILRIGALGPSNQPAVVTIRLPVTI